MAEFKISRIRYTWRGNWTTGVAYNRDDVVKYGGSSWVCVRKHTASVFNTDQAFLNNPGDTAPTPAWLKMADGRSYRGDWNQSTLYIEGDIFRYGGNLYLTVTSFTSSSIFDNDLANLATYLSAINWRNNWTQNTRYAVGDLVRYGGQVYKCIFGHTSSSNSNGPEIGNNDSLNDSTLEVWEIYYSNSEFKGVYSSDSVRYKINDIVLYNGSLLRCIETYESASSFDSSKWTMEADGNEFESEWTENTYYGIGSVVRSGGYVFYAAEENYNNPPNNSIYQTVGNIAWQILSESYNLRGNWSSTETYKTGDVVRRGGYLYKALLDSTDDGSSLDYLDSSNWEILLYSQNWRNFWTSDQRYSVNDVVIYLGNTYSCNVEHLSDETNFPGDNGSGFEYWDLLLKAGSEAGLIARGDLLTYNLNRSAAGDGSSFGITRVGLGSNGQLVTVNSEDSVIYKSYGQVARVFYVDLSGVDDNTDPQRGLSPFKPWRTVRFACEQADDGYTGTTTVRVGAGKYEEILPIIIPKNTVVLGSELRTTTIAASLPIPALALDSIYTIAVLTRISQLIQSVIAGTALPLPKSPGNLENPVVLDETVTTQVSFVPPQFDEEGNEIFDSVTSVQKITTDAQAALDVQTLIVNIISYINFFVNSTGSNPTLVGTNTATTVRGYLNAVLQLEANKEFLVEESVAFMRSQFSSYAFDADLCRRDVRRYIDAWKYDLTYTGNYKSILAARYYRNAVLGSTSEDMFYVRDSTGVRNCTLNGLSGTLNPPLVADIFRLPTGGSYISLDPGWGPNDNRTWITNRSPYIQGVTTFGTGCIGQKIDGNLHNGGNKSIVSNDFTQVISDGIGAWVTNNGRAELVSVFTYYAHIGYLAGSGGIIRATNGNCSYGRFGAIADGVDLTEVPKTGVTYTRAQQAIVAAAFAGDFVDEIQILEWTNAGQDYTSASASFVGAGVDAEVVFEDFRDDALFEARRVDVGSGISEEIGGSGYVVIQNNAQTGDLTTITIAGNDPNSIGNYLGMRIILTSGPGTGQYGYITGYDNVTKIVNVSRESDDQPGWDHVVPGKPSTNPLTTGTTYRIEPRVIFSAPQYFADEIVVPTNTTWTDIAYSDTTETYLNLTAGPGTGTVVPDDGLVPVEATFNVTKTGRNYSITVVNPGAGYEFGQELVISGDQLGGETPLNDLTILVTEVSDDSTNSIVSAIQKTYGTGEDNEAASGRFVAISSGGSAGVYSSDGINWTSFNMPSSGDWSSIVGGDNKFVAVKRNSNGTAYSLDGITWIARTMPASRQWNAVTYGGGVFVAVAGNFDSGAFSTNGTSWTATTLPDIGDSTFNEWVDIAYGKNTFVALSNSGNYVAVGVYDSNTNTISWTGRTMDVIDDSSNKSWQSIAYGNNRFVAISNTGEVAYSFEGTTWYPATMPSLDDSTAHNWRKIKYAQGVFFAVGDTGARPVGDDATSGPTTFAATSFDGIVWTSRELASEESWASICFGNPYVQSRDSSVGKRTPMWIAIPDGSDKFNKIQTGARALGRVTVSAGVISSIRLWDTGSGYVEAPTLTLVDPNNTSDVSVECRMGDSVLTNPSWINRGLGYRTQSTRITITGNGFADVTPSGKFIVINDLDSYPGPGAQMTIQGLDSIYTLVTVTPIGPTDRGLAAIVRVSPEIKNRDNLQHLIPVIIRSKFSQCRITGHDFLDIGTGNFEETNYPELYSGFYTPAPENEIVEEDGGRVFYTSTDQNGNFRCGELFAVEQATGTVTISADFFDFSGLTELRLGGIRLGGTGAVVREFSTDPLFTEDSNNVVPTQRAIRAYLAGRLSVGGSEIAVGSFIAGTISVGPDKIGNVASLRNIVPVIAEFDGPEAGISGSWLAQYMFFKSF